MSRSSRIAFWLALLALLAAPAFATISSKPARKPAKKAAQPAEPQRPPLPQELPPLPPSVSYRGGLLTIVTQNSTLYDILAAVRKATGAAVDAPASAIERVATRLGPGRPRDVLTELLNGSRFDYILLSTPDDPGGVRRLILRPRSGEGFAASAGGDVAGSAANAPAAVRPAPGTRTLPPDTSEDDNSAPEQTVEPAEEVVPEPQPQIAPPQPPDVRSPEQLQEEMRRQQEELQRQQQQQQQQEQPPQ